MNNQQRHRALFECVRGLFRKNGSVLYPLSKFTIEVISKIWIGVPGKALGGKKAQHTVGM